MKPFSWLRSPATTRSKIAGYLIGLLISIGIALAVVFTALQTQSSRVLDENGLAWSFSLLFGPAAFGESAEQAWSAAISGNWQSRDSRFYWNLLRVYTYADFGFVAVYSLLALILAFRIYRGWGRRFAGAALGMAVAADISENVATLRVASGKYVEILSPLWATRIRWIALALLVTILVLGVLIRQVDIPSPINRYSISRLWQAILIQRLSLLPAIAFFVLSVTAGSAILEQLPDVERGWVDNGLWNTNAFWALEATVLVTVSVFVTTRLRLAFARAVAANPCMPAPKAKLRHWLIGPGVVMVTAVLAIGVGNAGLDFWKYELQAGSPELHLLRLAIFVGVPAVLIVGISGFLRLRRSKPGDSARPDYTFPPVSAELVAAVAFIGNVTTVALLVVAGLGVIRAFAPLVIVGSELELGRELIGRARIWLLFGSLAVVGPWLALITLTLRASKLQRPLKMVGSWKSSWVGGILLATWVAIFLTFAIAPTLAADIGLAATAVFGIGALTGMISATALLMQAHAPAEVFRVVGMRRTPYVTVLLLTLLLVGLFSGAGSIHELDRGKSESQNPIRDRTDLETAFRSWIAMKDPCRITVGNRQVRPLLLIAAEGGGIRAAYWTVRSLEALGHETCLGRSALFSSGASGGSVGLTVARFSGTAADPGIQRAVDTVDQMASDEILAAGADGMFTRDIFYGATGVPLPRLDVPHGTWTWIDRARLIEQGWQDAYDRAGEPWGTRSFLNETDLSPVTGHLILNSTSVKGNCRVWVSQLTLPPNSTAPNVDTFDPEHNCDKVPGPGARTIDLFAAYGPHATGVVDTAADACIDDISAATAALLTARFPYVTPSGVVGPCPGASGEPPKDQPYWPTTQLVDGGYIENSGLATITDLASEWQRLVRNYNAQAADPAKKMDLIVPFVVYLSNGDLDTTRPKLNQGPTSEISLPLFTYLSGGSSLSGTNALLERARESVQIDGFCVVQPVCSELDKALTDRVIVVDRLPRPEISAPLGWALSGSTRLTLDRAIDYQFEANCAGKPQPQVCRLGYAPLGQLRQYAGATR